MSADLPVPASSSSPGPARFCSENFRFVQSFTRIFEMRLFVSVLCVGIVIALGSGCTPSNPKPPPMAKVSGKVTLDGDPMKEGEIEFEAPAQPPRTLKIEGGAFSGEVFSGKNVVRLHMFKEGPPASTDPDKKPMKLESLPAKYNAKTTLSADVPAAGATDLKFDATSN